jgi:hypothetical protein
MVAAGTLPQTSSEFHARYGKPDAETFNVRPGILLNVEYGEDGEACAMRIQPRRESHAPAENPKPAPMDVITAVLDEAVPPEQRGKELGPGPDIGMRCHGAATPTEFENVIIRTYYGLCNNPPIPQGVEVRFKRPACEKVKPEIFPPAPSKPH